MPEQVLKELVISRIFFGIFAHARYDLHGTLDGAFLHERFQ
jgi:hypothetical protein